MDDGKYTFQIRENFSLFELAKGIENILLRKDMMTNLESLYENTYIITATNVSGIGSKFWRNVSGTAFSLSILLEVKGNTLTLCFDNQSWHDKAAGYILSLWIWPFAFTATYGTVRQVSLEKEILDYVNDILKEEVKLSDMCIRKRIICATPLISLIIFLTMGFVWNMWGYGALAFLLIPLMPFFLGEINLEYIYPLVVTGVYIGLGFGFNFWHPGWIVFLTIPVYYIIFPVKKQTIRRCSC